MMLLRLRWALIAGLAAAALTWVVLTPRGAAVPVMPDAAIDAHGYGKAPALQLSDLESAVEADPDHSDALRPLAHFYALTILEGGPLAARARAGLDASRNVWVLGNAAYMLQSQYNLSLQMGRENRSAAVLAEQTFLRALAIDPRLDRRKILPSIDVAAQARAVEEDRQRMGVLFAEAVGKIRRLPVGAFPALPPAIAGELRARRCTVPQSEEVAPGAPHNVATGEFFAPGETNWAVLCSVDGVSTILVFRHEQDLNPASLASAEDRAYLQGLGGDRIGYSRMISGAGSDFITRHFRAHHGPAPPMPITHLGIDDAFVGKASRVWYLHQGNWLALMGAD